MCCTHSESHYGADPGSPQAPHAVVDPVASQQCHKELNSLSVAFPAAWGGVGAGPLCWGLCWRSALHEALHCGERGCMDSSVGSREFWDSPAFREGWFFFFSRGTISIIPPHSPELVLSPGCLPVSCGTASRAGGCIANSQVTERAALESCRVTL